MPHNWVNRTNRDPPRYNVWRCRNCGTAEYLPADVTPTPNQVISDDMKYYGTCEEIIVRKINAS